MLTVSGDDDGKSSVLGGRSLSMPLSLDIMEKRVMSHGIISVGDSPSSGSSCSWMMENWSDMELDRNHLATSRPVNSLNICHAHVIHVCVTHMELHTEHRKPPLKTINKLHNKQQIAFKCI